MYLPCSEYHQSLKWGSKPLKKHDYSLLYHLFYAIFGEGEQPQKSQPCEKPVSCKNPGIGVLPWNGTQTRIRRGTFIFIRRRQGLLWWRLSGMKRIIYGCFSWMLNPESFGGSSWVVRKSSNSLVVYPWEIAWIQDLPHWPRGFWTTWSPGHLVVGPRIAPSQRDWDDSSDLLQENREEAEAKFKDIAEAVQNLCWKIHHRCPKFPMVGGWK